ncbi:MAG: O-antigen ligase family protein [Allosphingosinicella sp.]|uniref:O-antigen ligase family protein n=1 Tax=Allosphingosinicella sp. TaxID=2823234 RepID=UPI00392F2501
MSIRHFLVPAYLVLCILLGGASAAGFLQNLLLQLLALPMIVLGLASSGQGVPRAGRALIWLTLAMVVLVLLQLVPLPPSMWTALPGRDLVAAGYEMLGQPLPWLPISLSPDATLAALLWLLPAFAVMLGILRLGAYRPSYIVWALIGAIVISVMIASLQLTGGRDSPFYFYRVTNFGLGVGFFANSNHQATLLLSTIPFVAALYAARGKSRSLKTSSGLLVALSGVAMILAVGLAIGGSLAGFGLGIASAAASYLLYRYRRGRAPWWTLTAAGLVLFGAAALVFAGPISGGALLSDIERSTTSRQTMVSTAVEAIGDYFPTGAGVGVFPMVYRTYEAPSEVTTTWVNHAHSDLVEIGLETGLPGYLLLLVFLLWWGRHAYRVWIADEKPDHYARAAVIASAAIMAHSFVDYPLRTAAISALFAICLALMAQPRPWTRRRRSEQDGGESPLRHLSA